MRIDFAEAAAGIEPAFKSEQSTARKYLAPASLADIFDNHWSSGRGKRSDSQHKAIFGIVGKVRPVDTIG